jgi:hypothetical protein
LFANIRLFHRVLITLRCHSSVTVTD